MALNGIFTSNITFPNGIDQFPTVVDRQNVGGGSISTVYTKVWAEHFNKINNFIKTVEPLVNSNTAANNAAGASVSIVGLNYLITLPKVNIQQLLGTIAPGIYKNGFMPGVQVFPFEFVVTDHQDDSTLSYSQWPIVDSAKRLLFQTSPSALTTLFGGYSMYSTYPMVSCNLTPNYPVARPRVIANFPFTVNAYCQMGQYGLLIRGSVEFNVDSGTTDLGTLLMSLFNLDQYNLQVTIMGVIHQ